MRRLWGAGCVPLALAVAGGCFDPPLALAPASRTAIHGTLTATTTRWAPVMTAPADWRTPATDRLLVAGQPLLRFRDPARPTVFAFWATYCPPCFAELPFLKRLHDEKQVAVVSVSLDSEDTALAAAALAHHHVAHRTVVLTKAGLRAVGPRLPKGLPTSIVVGVDGQVLGQHDGILDDETLTTLLHRADQ